jgi:hypothetical protein
MKAAEELVRAKERELAEAEAVVLRIRGEVGAALQALRDARVAADAGLPQCDMVLVSSYRQEVSRTTRMAILRKTPTGMLTLREVGGNKEYRFKPTKWSVGGFALTPKEPTFGNGYFQLRDVPAEYLPKEPT